MRHGTHDDPVRPKGSRSRKPRIPRVKRPAITYRDHTDERLLWRRGRWSPAHAGIEIPYNLSSDDLHITDELTTDNVLGDTHHWLDEILNRFEAPDSDEVLERVLRAAILLKARNAGTFAECLEQALIWEVG